MASVLAGLVVGLALRSILATQSYASHPYPVSSGTHDHLRSMTNFDTENYCVDVGFSDYSKVQTVIEIAGYMHDLIPTGGRI